MAGQERGGIVIAFLAMLLMVVADTGTKLLVAGIPLYQLLAVNALCGLVVILFRTAHNHEGMSALKTHRPVLHFLRALIGLIAAIGFVYGIREVPLPVYYTASFTAPLLIALLARVILREPLKRAVMPLVLGFSGIAVAFMPALLKEVPAIAPDGIAALALAVFCAALSMILIRIMRKTEKAETLAFYPFLMDATIMLALWLILGGVTYTPQTLAGNILVGFVGIAANLLNIQSYRLAPAAHVAPVQYSQLLWGIAAGYLFWADIPDLWLLTGAALIMLAGWHILTRTKNPLP